MAALPTLPGLPGNLVMLEHINITVGEAWCAELEALWFGVLGAARDPRTKTVLERMYGEEEAAARGLVWANFGVQQVVVVVVVEEGWCHTWPRCTCPASPGAPTGGSQGSRPGPHARRSGAQA